jgi:hypothetical protein
MGGRGSGRFGIGRKRTTCEALRVDLFHLARHGMLTPGRISRLTWMCRGEPSGGIRVLAYGGRVILLFRVSVDGQEWETCYQSIALVTVPTNFGQRRLFKCPTCSRACRDLYGGRTRFACRKCLGLPYVSQYQSDSERAADQARALRRKLGASAESSFYAPLSKPPRMRLRTYQRLLAQDAVLAERCARGLAASLERSQRRAYGLAIDGQCSPGAT